MRVTYKPESETHWEDVYSQKGQGFVGGPYQRGSGLGSIFRSIFRFILPAVKTYGKQAAKTVGKQALKTAGKIASDVTQGRNLEESLKEHGRIAAADLLSKAAARMQKGKGLGFLQEKHIKTIEGPRKKKRKLSKKDNAELPYATIYD